MLAVRFVIQGRTYMRYLGYEQSADRVVGVAENIGVTLDGGLDWVTGSIWIEFYRLSVARPLNNNDKPIAQGWLRDLIAFNGGMEI